MTARAPGVAAASWFPFGRPPGSVRLYCLPHAGGSASKFALWSRELDGVAVWPVQLPGRESRLGQTPYTLITDLVGDLAAAVFEREKEQGDGRYAVYGHSLGATVGFELLRELRRLGAPAPMHLFVSGALAPDDPAQDRDPAILSMGDEEIADLLRGIGGTPEWLLRDRTALRLILPMFRADFAVKQSYVFRPEAPLDAPVTAIAATHDPRIEAAGMRGWARHTASRFDLRTVPGGHFAVLERPESTHRIIRGALAAAPVR